MRSHSDFHDKSIDRLFPLISQSQETGGYEVTYEVACKTCRPFLQSSCDWLYLQCGIGAQGSQAAPLCFPSLPLQHSLFSILCSRPSLPQRSELHRALFWAPALLPHAHARGFSGDQLADDSQVLPTAHLSFLSHRRVYPAASSAPSLDAPN